jgi:hypothetical protein
LIEAMTPYRQTEHLYTALKVLFAQLHDRYPAATRAVSAARMVIRLKSLSPPGEIFIDGRREPAVVTFGPSSLRPELDIELSGEALHRILMGELSLMKALGSGQMKVYGPVWKTKRLADIFTYGQHLYPQVWQEHSGGPTSPPLG